MQLAEIIQRAREIAQAYRITKGDTFRLKDIDPEDTAGLEAEDKLRAQEGLQAGVQALAALQDRLYAQDRQVVAFKEPSAEELDHDYLWRCVKHLPERGRIGIFNRSYYEEVLVVRVHEDLLHKQHLPPELITKDLWQDRLRDM